VIRRHALSRRTHARFGAHGVGPRAGLALALSLALSPSAQAGEWETRWPLLIQHQAQSFDANAPTNPDNRIYRFEDDAQRIELRPELRYVGDAFTVDLSPRLSLRRASGRSGGIGWSDRGEDVELRYARVQYAKGDAYVRAGRYVNLWGPSLLLSPSNPFHADSGQTSPQVELAARDHVEAGYAFDARHALGAIVNVGRGDQTIDDFHRTVVLKYDYTADTASLSALAIRQDGRSALGGFGQWTPSDSWVLYADGAIQQGRQLPAYPQQASLEPDRDRDWNGSLLIGGAYSFADGTTFALEAYRNGSGLTDSERTQLFSLQQQALIDLQDPARAAQAGATLRTIADIPLGRMGRDYAMARLQRSNLWDQLDLAAIHIRNLDDNSRQTTLKADWFATDALQWFAVWTRLDGAARSEYGRFIDQRWTIGLRWSLR